MTITVESGRLAAKTKAGQNIALFDTGNQTFGRLINTYKADVPLGLALAHLVSVNPTLVTNPPILSSDGKRGFMKASMPMAKDAGIPWKNLDDPQTCAYVWGYGMNKDSLSLYTTNQALFTKSDKDFWATAYLKHRLGAAVFNALFSQRDTTQATVYDSLLYSVNALTRHVLRIPVIAIKHLVLIECQFVIELAQKAGSLSSSGFGIQPVLSKNAILQVF
jgi:hypothetical protein